MYRKEKRIPTILALLIIFLGVSGTVFFDKMATGFTTSANPGISPQEVHITDISDKSFTVSWLTAKSTTGSVVISNNAFSAIYLDDLDNDNISRPRTTHYISVKNLNEDTAYNVKIISGGSKCNSQEGCPIFTQKTPVRLPVFSSLPPVKGQIVTKENEPANTAIVYLMIGQSAPLSGRVDSSGLWVIPFHNLRSSDLTGQPDLADDNIVQITVKASMEETATAVTDVKTIRQNLTIPILQLGSSYNFINLESKKDLIAKNLNDRKILGAQTKTNTPTSLPPIDNNISPTKTIDILFPKQNGDSTIDNRPRLRGTGPKDTTLNITINSTPQTAKIRVGPDGIWSWSPPKTLTPGTHTVTIQGYDKKGNLISETKQFTVLKSGEGFILGEATASASLTPTVTATPGAATSPSPSITPAQTTVSPTVIPSPTILNSPTPTIFVPSSTPVPPPIGGNFQPALLLFGVSSTLLLIGAKLLLLP